MSCEYKLKSFRTMMCEPTVLRAAEKLGRISAQAEFCDRLEAEISRCNNAVARFPLEKLKEDLCHRPSVVDVSPSSSSSAPSTSS